MAQEPEQRGTGLILGKFLPFHRGHQYLIEAARERVDDLTVLVCSLEREPIPGEARHRWVSEAFPDVRVVHVTDENPSEPHEHPEFWEIWIDTIRRRLPEGPDLVFTSERYGDELARRLGARHVLVDLARDRFPVSGTCVRENPMAYWEYLPPCVRPYFVRRVCVYGAESTGKTTLARQLSQHYSTVWAAEYARGYLDEKGEPCEAEDIPHIARGHMASEDALARQANRVLFSDTDLITTTIWSDYYFGGCPEWIREAADARTYDLTLLTDIDVPWVADPQRDCGHLRQHFHDLFRSQLEARGRPYVLISGTWKERFRRACEAVDALILGRSTPG